jgi:excinuclease ABC subunit A
MLAVAAMPSHPWLLPAAGTLRPVRKPRGKQPGRKLETEPGQPSPSIQVRGARVHNLKNIDVDLSRDRLVVLTGVSGSGKSSLAFDTIFAEGQRRYLECLSSSARQFLDQLERPEVDAIDGLPPTVAIDQRAGTPNPRSTLGTITEIYDYLRLLFARAGAPHCPSCGAAIRRQTPEQMVAQLMSLAEGRKVQLLAPLVRDRKGQHLDTFQAIRRAGLIRARVDGQMVEVTDAPPKLAKTKTHTIEAVVDRIAIREGIRPRLAESLDLVLKLSGGTVLTLIESPPGWDEQLLSIHLSCPACGTGLPELEPRNFSFNSPHGACHVCQGLGSHEVFQAEPAVPDRSRSWDQGAVVPWVLLAPGGNDGAPREMLVRDFLARHEIHGATPLESWPPETWRSFWFGEPGGSFPGLASLLEQSFRETKSESLRKTLEAYRAEVLCPTCDGSRLRPEARAVRVAGKSIHDLTSLAIGDFLEFLRSAGPLPDGRGSDEASPLPRGRITVPRLQVDPSLEPVVAQLIREIAGRLQYLVEVGLDYLSLGRGSDTLSGGELQRARLAAQLGSGLVGVCYILDEPTAGLHPRDTRRLIASLRRLLDLGNSVLVVDHDASVIQAADWVLDLGPGAGPDGGSVVAAGPPDQLATANGSITAQYLRRGPATDAIGGGRERQQERLTRSPGWIRIRDAAVHNLKHIEAQIPLGTLTCVTGVSGSGKSTLVHDVLARAVRRALHRSGDRHDEAAIVTVVGSPWSVVCGDEDRSARYSALETPHPTIDQLIEVDQSPIGRTPRSTPATATGLFDAIRRVFAATREAKVRGYRASRFSFNAKGGRCEACQGLGRRRIPMQFLPDLYVTCDECGGQRFNRQTLEARFKGKSIGDVLEMRVDESRSFFEAVPRVLQGLEALHDVGLGYLTLGQSSTTLSGGEAQRVKLAAELGRPSGGHALYILDEPTTGLHFADIDRLLRILHRLVDLGHTVVVIEHHLDVIASADWVIDLGPDGGEAGGRIVAMGPPSAIAASEESRTGQALRLMARA